MDRNNFGDRVQQKEFITFFLKSQYMSFTILMDRFSESAAFEHSALIN